MPLNDSALLLHAPCDGDVVDVTGNGHDGTITGDVTFVASDRAAQAASLPGSDDYITWANPFHASISNQFSVHGWFNAAAAGNFSMLFSMAGNNTLNVQGCELRLHSTTGFPSLAVCTSGATTNATAAESIVGAGWVPVGAAYNGTDIRLYVYGALAGGPTARTGNVAFTAVPVFRSGVRGGTTDFDYNGLMRDLRVYNRALSAAEFKALAHSLPLVGGGLVGTRSRRVA